MGIKTLELFGGELNIKVHSDGKIETLTSRNIRSNGRKDNRKGKILKPNVDKYGYENITLSNKGFRKTFLVHRLVALVFIPNPLNKPTVNHKDGNKVNNDVSNLEWATHKEQKSHSIELGLADKNIDILKKSNEKRSRAVYFRGCSYPSINQAALINKVHKRVVEREGDFL